MDKYLQQILHEINTIIIPNLGALTVTKKETGEVMFMPFLKHDDGNLSKIIAEKENISENDSKNLIAKYVREITAKLDMGDTYDMFQFGRFIKKNGEIEFENWNQYQHAETNEVKPIVVASNPVIESVEEVKKEESKPTLDEIIEKPISIDVASINPDENVYIPKEELKHIEIEPKLEAKVEQKEEVPVKVVPNPIKKDKNVVKINIKKKRGVGFWMLILVGLLILGGGVGGFLFKDKISEFLNDRKVTIAENEVKPSEEDQEAMEEKVGLEAPLEENAPEEIVEEKAETIAAPIEEKMEAPKKQEVNTSNAFHLIVGGFTVEDNANRFAKKFQNEGKNSIVLGKFDDKFLVSYESFSTKEEANSAMKSMSIPAWVFKYNK